MRAYFNTCCSLLCPISEHTVMLLVGSSSNNMLSGAVCCILCRSREKLVLVSLNLCILIYISSLFPQIFYCFCLVKLEDFSHMGNARYTMRFLSSTNFQEPLLYLTKLPHSLVCCSARRCQKSLCTDNYGSPYNLEKLHCVPVRSFKNLVKVSLV